MPDIDFILCPRTVHREAEASTMEAFICHDVRHAVSRAIPRTPPAQCAI